MKDVSVRRHNLNTRVFPCGINRPLALNPAVTRH
ncbi:hypothetical protein EMIT0P74_40206 [Pseudomonas sp. IT-P74]